ncbi:MAG: transporter substrate-binding protein [Marmoricola sp.]|nr:transporter substrate-binding protein [Marmoricola sp.]
MSRAAKRDPLVIGLIGILGIAVVLIGLFRLDDLPFVNSGQVGYRADFTDAGGLRTGDPVEISGIRVGAVRRIDIAANHVVIEFRVGGPVRLGSTTTAGIKVGSLLGAKYLEVEPHGSGRLAHGATIPLARTTAAYDVVEAFSQLTETAGAIDKKRVAQALDTIATTFAGSPSHVRGVLHGLATFSAAIASRDTEVKELLRHARGTTEVLARRRGDIGHLVSATNQVLAELATRRTAIHRLLVTTTALADQLDGVVTDNQATLNPALRDLHGVVTLLAQRQHQLGETVRNLDVFLRVFTNTLGSGRWFDAIIPNVGTAITLGGAR